MTLLVPSLPVAIAQFRDPGEVIPVRFRGPRRFRRQGLIHERLVVANRALMMFEQQWPQAAASVEFVEVVPELPSGSCDNLALSDTRTLLGEVFSRIHLKRSLLTDTRLDDILKEWSHRGDVVASGLAGLLWHEFAHVLLNTLALRAEPRTRSAEAAARLVISRAVGDNLTVTWQMAASTISRRAGLSPEEFVAEAVADHQVSRDHVNPVCVDVVSVLVDLWGIDVVEY